VKGSNTFGQRYATQAATNRAAADTASLTVERYFTVTAEGNGESFNIQSDTPSAGNKIVRKIWYKDEAFEDTDVDTWTLLHTFADDTTYANTATKWQEYLDGQANGTPPFTLAISWEDIPAFTGLLDTYGGAALAYSLRLLDSTYTGDAIRVRRASDNTEQDIGFDVNGDLDTSALTTFCSGTNGFIRTWYDQSGGARNIEQATTASQPKIYDSSIGVIIDPTTSRPAVFGTGTLRRSQVLTQLHDGTSMTVATASLQNAANGVQFGRTLRFYPEYGGLVYWDTPTRASATSESHANGLICFAYRNGADKYAFQNNISKISTTDATALPTTTETQFDIVLDSGAYGFEFIWWNSDQSANRAGIETNINDYYSIY
jgi:hypothetical protein